MSSCEISTDCENVRWDILIIQVPLNKDGVLIMFSMNGTFLYVKGMRKSLKYIAKG